MARISVLGGTGFAGGHIVREAAARGHDVTVWARHTPGERLDGVTYRSGDVLDDTVLAEAVRDADVVVEALAPRGPLDGRLRDVDARLAELARTARARLGVIGGAGSLLVAPDGPMLAETDEFLEAFRPEALQMAAVLEDLRGSPADLDWFYVSPAVGFGAHAPGTDRGEYRLGGDVVLGDASGESFVSGADLARAVVDEIDNPAHRRRRFTVAY